jgi:hypothetical protein
MSTKTRTEFSVLCAIAAILILDSAAAAAIANDAISMHHQISSIQEIESRREFTATISCSRSQIVKIAAADIDIIRDQIAEIVPLESIRSIGNSNIVDIADDIIAPELISTIDSGRIALGINEIRTAEFLIPAKARHIDSIPASNRIIAARTIAGVINESRNADIRINDGSDIIALGDRIPDQYGIIAGAGDLANGRTVFLSYQEKLADSPARIILRT